MKTKDTEALGRQGVKSSKIKAWYSSSTRGQDTESSQIRMAVLTLNLVIVFYCTCTMQIRYTRQGQQLTYTRKREIWTLSPATNCPFMDQHNLPVEEICYFSLCGSLSWILTVYINKQKTSSYCIVSLTDFCTHEHHSVRSVGSEAVF